MDEVSGLGLTKPPQQSAQLFKAAKPEHKFKLPEKPDVDTCIQIILKDVSAGDTTVNGDKRQHLYPSQRARASVRPKPSATWSTPQLNLENLLNVLNYDPLLAKNSCAPSPLEERKSTLPSQSGEVPPSHPVLRSDKMLSEFEIAKRNQKKNGFTLPAPEKTMVKEDSSISLN